MNQQKEENIEIGEEVYSKTETFVNDNKKGISVVVAALVILVGGYFAFKEFYLSPRENKATERIWEAELMFEKDSLDRALAGDPFYGFVELGNKYSGTKSATLADYYSGISYLKKGEFETAIDYLKLVDFDDQMIGPLALGAIGDCLVELENLEEGVAKYMAAVNAGNNDLLSPYFLKKAGMVYEKLGQKENAYKAYERILKEFPASTEGNDIKKYLARTKA